MVLGTARGRDICFELKMVEIIHTGGVEGLLGGRGDRHVLTSPS